MFVNVRHFMIIIYEMYSRTFSYERSKVPQPQLTKNRKRWMVDAEIGFFIIIISWFVESPTWVWTRYVDVVF